MNKLTSILLMALTVASINATAQDSSVTAEPKRTSLALVPAIANFKLDRGQTQTQTINVVNTLRLPYRLRVYMEDWIRDSTGDHRYMPAGTSPQSCARWVTLDKTYLEVQPGETGSVNVTMIIPDSAEAVTEMKWAMVFIETVQEKAAPMKSEKLQTRVLSSFRLGAHVYQTPPSAEFNKELKMLSFAHLKDREYRVMFKNTGGTQLKCLAKLELVNEDGVKIDMKPKEVSLFPKQVRYLDFQIPDSMAKGKYSAIALLDAGDDEVPLEAAQLEITIE